MGGRLCGVFFMGRGCKKCEFVCMEKSSSIVYTYNRSLKDEETSLQWRSIVPEHSHTLEAISE